MQSSVVSEKTLEKGHAARVRRAGGRSYKFTSPGRRGVADRLDMYPATDEWEAFVVFVEVKGTGGRLTPLQRVELSRLARMGFAVFVCSTHEESRQIVEWASAGRAGPAPAMAMTFGSEEDPA